MHLHQLQAEGKLVELIVCEYNLIQEDFETLFSYFTSN